jgi:1,4-dihydroxy-2-naphthoate octaprenyltransferase
VRRRDSLAPIIPEHAGVIPASLASIAPGSFRAWVLACRPATLPAAVVPVFVGTAAATATGGAKPWPALAALVGALLLQIGANFANDLFDHQKGADTAERLGPTRAVQAGLIDPASMRLGMAVVFGSALVVGVYLTIVAGPWLVALGLASIVAALAYTGGPYPLGYHGLGEAAVFAFFGFVAVCGTAFVQLGEVPTLALYAALPVGALASTILVVNNVRDRVTDAAARKRTLAVRFGKRWAIAEYMALFSVAYAVPIWLTLEGHTNHWVLMPLITLPVALRRILQVSVLEGHALNAELVATARLMFAFGMLFALGIALGPLSGL